MHGPLEACSTSPSAPALRLSNITKSFAAVRALRGVSFDTFPGEVHALIGENGAGKSSLIRIITGAEQPDSGTIELNNVIWPRLSPATARALGVAAIYQQPALFPHLSVVENIAFGFEDTRLFRRVRWQQRLEHARHLLAHVGAEMDPETLVSDLSMPEQQLLEIARALGAGARLLIMDEPTASLTAREVDLLLGLIKNLRSQGVGIIYISHRLEEIFRIADRVTVLRDGESVGTHPVKAGIEATPSLPGSIPYEKSSSVIERDLIRLMVGREISSIFPPAENTPGDCILSVRGLGCRKSGVHDVSFELRGGEILGLAGLIGAGRTELARVLFGLTPADSGVVEFYGKALRLRAPGDAIAAGIAYLPEDRRRHGIILQLPITANMTLAILSKFFPAGWMQFNRERLFTADYIREFVIKTPSPDAAAAQLSGGNQQKVALARWLAASPKLIILDEPTQGVDIGAKSEIHKFIRRLAAQGMAVLMISSELPEILAMSDRVAVMRGGTIVTILESSKTQPHELLAAALGRDVAEKPSRGNFVGTPRRGVPDGQASGKASAEEGGYHP